MTRLYLTTTAERAQYFLEHREKARTGRPQTQPAGLPPETVTLTDRPVDFRYGMTGEVIFAVQLSRGAIGRYERKDAIRPFRTWILPITVFLRLLRTMNMV